MMKRYSIVATAAFLVAAALVVNAQSAGSQRAGACASPVHRQFDFWLGSWSVTDYTTHKPQGRNVVTSELDGCVLQEHWTGAGGVRGTSFNAYDASRKVWHQTWVDMQGTVLLLDGNLAGSSMVMSGTGVGKNGKPFRQRITWTPLPGGDVRQHWEYSTDGGLTWTNVFDGRYTRT